MLILASQSPRRRELLSQAGFTFEVQPSSHPEVQREGEDGISFAIRLAREKAEAVFALRRPADDCSQPLLVLGADTAVLLEGQTLGKPSSPSEAARMLHQLSGKTHQVVTGVAVAGGYDALTITDSAAEITNVTMLTLSEREISQYVATGEPMDKAGAYAIQGYAGQWIPRIRGCYFNVMGLPLALVANLLSGAQLRLAKLAR